MKNDEFYVLLGDVISSKKIKNREEFQKELINTCFELNELYKEDMYAKFEIIKGLDEIGCLLEKINNLYEIISLILNRLYPYSMRFVLVKGHVDTGLSTKKVSQMDGPAFHKASNLMQLLKGENLIFKMDSGSIVIDKLITNNINLIYLLKRNWSLKKTMIIKEYEKKGDQKAVAKKLGLTQQTVSYHIKSSSWKELRKIENDLKESLKIFYFQVHDE